MKLVDEANLISRYVEVLKNKSKFLVTMSHYKVPPPYLPFFGNGGIAQVRFRDNVPLYTWGASAQPGMLGLGCAPFVGKKFSPYMCGCTTCTPVVGGFRLHISNCEFESDELHPNDSELIRAYGHMVYSTPRCQSNEHLLICSRAPL